MREELSFAITQPIAHPEQYAAMGLGAATGVLLYGPPGCGKTLVAKAIANESGVNFISIKVCSAVPHHVSTLDGSWTEGLFDSCHARAVLCFCE